MFRKVMVIFLVYMATISAALAGEDALYPILENDLWGYMNRQGETVIEPQYDLAEPFGEDGFAVVGKKENRKVRCGLIDREGNTVLPLIYIDLFGENGVYNLTGPDENGQIQEGFYNTRNGFFQPPVYDEVYLNEHFVQVVIGNNYGFVRCENGEIAIEVEHPWTPYEVGEQEGYLFLTEGSESGEEGITCRLLDENLQDIPLPEGLMPMGWAKDGVVPVENVSPEENEQNVSAGVHMEMGLARVDGTVLHEAEFDYVHEAHNGVVPFWENDLCGHMDLEGNVIVPAKYEVMAGGWPGYWFYGDYALIDEEDRYRYVVIDRQGNEVFVADRFTDQGMLCMEVITEDNLTEYSWYADDSNLSGLMKFEDGQARYLTEPIFESVHLWNGEDGLYPAKQNGLYGFIDENGQWVLEPEWDDTYGFENGLAWVEKDCKAAYIDREGNVVWQETRE